MRKVEIVIKDGELYALRDDGVLLNILVDVYNSPVYGNLIVINSEELEELK